MAIVGRAVPWPLQVKNREKARERIYFPVCLPLTLKNGDKLKRLEGHEYGTRSAKCSTLTVEAPGYSASNLQQKEENKIMSKGKVKFFNTSRGFGFITQNEGKDLFFHVSELRAEIANEGDQVEYEIGESKKGPCAVNIREAYSAY